jgi:hypothetical protein
MTGGNAYPVEIDLRNHSNGHITTLKIDVLPSSLSQKWLTALDHVLAEQLHLEKNYCFLGFTQSARHGWYILDQVNRCIQAINASDLDYHIADHFSMEDVITDEPDGHRQVGRNIRQHRLNSLHRYFEDLQGQSGRLSPHYVKADASTRWHIRQLNLLCHEFETWALSYRKEIEAPDWQRPSQLMCWLNAPRFPLDSQDHELFGIQTLNRDLGGVYVGVNKAVGKHHWEVFQDEGRDSRLSELTTTVLSAQSEAAADFDIEWGRNPSEFSWQKQRLNDFRQWLEANGFDPDDPSLTIGHPKVAQVDLVASFGTEDFRAIWSTLNKSLDVAAVRTLNQQHSYHYHWNDPDYPQRQIDIIMGDRA